MCGAVSPCSSAPETTFKFSTFKIIHSLCLDGQIRQQANRHIWMFFIKRCWSVQPCVDLCLHELQVTSRQEKAKGKRTLFFYVRKQRTCWFLLQYRSLLWRIHSFPAMTPVKDGFQGWSPQCTYLSLSTNASIEALFPMLTYLKFPHHGTINGLIISYT